MCLDRSRVAAPEQEAPMATPSKKVSAREAAVAVLRRAGKPMPIAEVAAGVLKTKGVKLTGKTPSATIAAILYTSPDFKRTGRGMVTLSAQGKKA
jgi:hypothetical protein